MELEQHPYGPESTREEREAIAGRVSVVDDRILLIHEVPVQSPFSVKLMFDRFQALAHEMAQATTRGCRWNERCTRVIDRIGT